MGDLTSLLEVIKITKSLQTLHSWSYSATQAIKLRTRLEEVVHESIQRAKQHELEGSWREAEYLWRSIKTYASADRPREIRIARLEAKSHPAKHANKIFGLSSLVALHERLGDFPTAEHELELLIARLPARPGTETGEGALDLEIKTLMRLYKSFQERVSGYEVTGLEERTLVELGSLSLLFRVAALEWPELYKALLKSNSNASMFLTPGEGPTLLHLSASIGSETFLTLLLGVGVVIDLLDYRGRTALHLAARGGHEAVVKLLLAAGARVNKLDMDNYSPLHFSCIDGHVAAANALLKAGAIPETRTAEGGFTPLHLAVKSGSLDLVQLLLEYGSDITAQTAKGRTVLHLATALGNESLVKLALKGGVEKDSRDIYGIRPIHDAPNTAIARLLLDHGADPHSPDKFNETPLLAAAWRNDTEVVTLLLAQRSNVNAQDDQGRTPLHRAVLKNRVDIVTVLLMGGADVSLKDSELKTPLHEAAHSGHVGLVHVLLKNGANQFLRDGSGKTPQDYVLKLRSEAKSAASHAKFDNLLSALSEYTINTYGYSTSHGVRDSIGFASEISLSLVA
jgi:ankyrin repeat protein